MIIKPKGATTMAKRSKPPKAELLRTTGYLCVPPA